MSNEDDLVARAREIAERAQHLADAAADSEELRAELDRLDRELASLDAEQRRLDEDMADREGEGATRDETSEPGRGWDELLSGLSVLGEKLGELGTRFRWRSNDTVERSVAVEGPLAVDVESRAGPIEIVVGTSDRVEVVAKRFAPSVTGLDDIDVTAVLDGDRVRVAADWPAGHRGRWVRLVVRVPSTSPVTASTRGGQINVAGTSGPATVTTIGGALHVDGTAGQVTAQTAGGSIRVADHDGPVDASTSGGSIHVSGHLTTRLEARTMGGSVTVDGLVDAVTDVTTAGGSIRVSGRVKGDSSFRTSGGSIAVTLPGDSNLVIDAKASSVRSDFPSLDADRGRLRGLLGDGTDGTLKLRTSGGAISITKS